MHSKLKGNIAETAVTLELQKNGYNVFTEIGDYSRIDLICEKDNKLLKIQVKYSANKGKMILHLKKSGPNGYKYTYNEDDVDWFAIYSPYYDVIAWVSSEEACKNKNAFTIRFTSTNNKQAVNIRFIADYTIEKFKSY